MSNFTKEVTVEEFWKHKYINACEDIAKLRKENFELFTEYNAAAKQANMHPLLQEPDIKDINPDTKWGDLDPELGAKLDRMQANEEVDF